MSKTYSLESDTTVDKSRDDEMNHSQKPRLVKLKFTSSVGAVAQLSFAMRHQRSANYMTMTIRFPVSVLQKSSIDGHQILAQLIVIEIT